MDHDHAMPEPLGCKQKLAVTVKTRRCFLYHMHRKTISRCSNLHAFSWHTTVSSSRKKSCYQQQAEAFWPRDAVRPACTHAHCNHCFNSCVVLTTLWRYAALIASSTRTCMFVMRAALIITIQQGFSELWHQKLPCQYAVGFST